MLSISKTSCIFGEFSKKEKKNKKNLIQQKLYLSRFLSSFSVQEMPLGLNASHSFLDFGEIVGFYLFFVSYFVLHNSYIRILTIHRYKSSWR